MTNAIIKSKNGERFMRLYTCIFNNKTQLELLSVNDIVWELNQRNIITDTALWLEKLDIDGDLYWLAYKIANLTQNK